MPPPRRQGRVPPGSQREKKKGDPFYPCLGPCCRHQGSSWPHAWTPAQAAHHMLVCSSPVSGLTTLPDARRSNVYCRIRSMDVCVYVVPQHWTNEPGPGIFSKYLLSKVGPLGRVLLLLLLLPTITARAVRTTGLPCHKLPIARRTQREQID